MLVILFSFGFFGRIGLWLSLAGRFGGMDRAGLDYAHELMN